MLEINIHPFVHKLSTIQSDSCIVQQLSISSSGKQVTSNCVMPLHCRCFLKNVSRNAGCGSHARGLHSKRDAHPAGDGAPRVWIALEILQRLFLPEHVLHGHVSATWKKERFMRPDVINTLSRRKKFNVVGELSIKNLESIYNSTVPWEKRISY